MCTKVQEIVSTSRRKAKQDNKIRTGCVASQRTISRVRKRNIQSKRIERISVNSSDIDGLCEDEQEQSLNEDEYVNIRDLNSGTALKETKLEDILSKKVSELKGKW